MTGFEKVFEDTALDLLKLAVVQLPSDIKDALKRAYKEETSEAGRVQFEAILKDIELAEKENTPRLCHPARVRHRRLRQVGRAQAGDALGDGGRIPQAGGKDHQQRPVHQYRVHLEEEGIV